MSIEIMLHKTLMSIGTLTEGIGHLTEATVDLVGVTKALHRERAAQIRQEVEELQGNDNKKLVNFTIWHLHERLKALEMPPRELPNGAAGG